MKYHSIAGGLAPVSLRKHLRARLPEYMIPQYFLPVEQIPLMPNGKIDRNKLPVPVVTESPIDPHEAPSDPVENTIAEIWTNLISPARSIGRADKFFEMGGHSLLALQALRQSENKFGLRLDLRVLFQESLAEIATRCQSERVAGTAGTAAARLPKPKVILSVRIRSESSAFGSLSQEVEFYTGERCGLITLSLSRTLSMVR